MPIGPVQQYSIGYGIEETPHQNALILTNEGNGGYESGGDVGKALGIITPEGSCQQADPFNGGTGWFAIGYLSPSDALNTGNFGGAPTNCWVTVDGVPSNNGKLKMASGGIGAMNICWANIRSAVRPLLWGICSIKRA